MAQSEGPKFQCAACGREFRWKPALAGKRAKCKCGAEVVVPARPPAAPAPVAEAPPEDPFAAFDVAGEQDVPVGPPPLPASAASSSAQNACPVCGAPALPTAVMCTSCGYNYRTGQRTVGFGRPHEPAKNRAPGRFAAEVYHKAARMAWAAPLIAFGIGCCCNFGAARSGNPTWSLFIGLFQLLLLVASAGLGIFALTGIRTAGRERILVPAVAGLSITGLIILASIAVHMAVTHGTGPFASLLKSRAARDAGTGSGTKQRQPRTLEEARKAGEEAFAEAGWLGLAQEGGGAVVLVTVSDESAMGAQVLPNLGTPVSLLVVGIDNTRGGGELTVDPRGATLHLADGKTEPLPDVEAVFRTAKSERDEALRRFSPPFKAPPGRQVDGMVMFLPPKTDPKSIAGVSLRINGRVVRVSGQYMTAEDKQAMRGSAAPSQ